MKRTSHFTLGHAVLVLAVLLTLRPAIAQQFGDFTCTSNDAAITIIGYTGPGGSVTIPGTINGLPVTRIEDEAFLNRPNLTSITVPSTVTSIGNSAFAHCQNLTNASMPNSLTSLGNAAFHNNTSLRSVTIPEGLTQIPNDAFFSCLNLANVTISSGVTNIGHLAFYHCTSLTSVTIPESVTYIGIGAFQRCTSLTNVTVGGGVTVIRGVAFADCDDLVTFVVDPANPAYCSLDGVLFNKDLTMLWQCPGARPGSYAVPNSVTSIGYAAFQGCTGLTSVTIPSSVTNIWTGAFRVCPSLKGVFFQGNPPRVAGDAFDYSNPTAYYLPGTTGWGETYAGCPALLWNPLMQASGPNFGVGPDGFGFNIVGTTNIPIVVEACSNLGNANWVKLQSLNLTNGLVYFTDPDARPSKK